MIPFQYELKMKGKTEGQVHCLVFAQDSEPVPLSSMDSATKAQNDELGVNSN